MAAAALAVAAGSASAQTLKADIPFTFRAGKSLLAPGTYQLNMSASRSRSYFILRNTETGSSVMLGNFNPGDVPKNWRSAELPKMGFECLEGRCVLREVWSATDATAYHFHGPKLGRDGDLQMTEITMSRVKAE